MGNYAELGVTNFRNAQVLFNLYSCVMATPIATLQMGTAMIAEVTILYALVKSGTIIPPMVAALFVVIALDFFLIIQIVVKKTVCGLNEQFSPEQSNHNVKGRIHMNSFFTFSPPEDLMDAIEDILWYGGIFALIGTLVFASCTILMNEVCSAKNKEDSSIGLEHDPYLDCNKEPIFRGEIAGLSDAADVLQNLDEKSVITGTAWTAWSTVKDTLARHICKMDVGVDCSGLDFVVKKINVFRQWSKDPPVTVVTTNCSVPSGIKLTGIVAIDYWIDGTGATCQIQASTDIVTLKSQPNRGMHYTILVIGRNMGGTGNEVDSGGD
ncbi:hypothetical protein Fcan01_18113 [Folsomia candida]|uniref:Uncharacterized protein n=1 Tax=Folsomia candida TaxID=158441 RepID=A0A226DMT1_FOLCA|nr:hypothetical protein Fcan01_18113 [Folsomia candida]